MRAGCCTLILTTLLTSLPSTPASARPTPREQASVLYRAGNNMYQLGDYQGALEKYRQARRLYRSWKLEYNIAETLLRLDRHPEAAEQLETFLLRYSAEAAREKVDAARARLASLRRRLSSLQVECAVPRARVLVDDKLWGLAPLKGRIYLRPGPHRLIVEHRGYRRYSRRLAARAGTHDRLRVRLEREAPPATATGVEGALAARHRTQTIWGYTALGGGVALVATAGVLCGLGVSQGNTADDQYHARTGEPGASEAEIAGYYDDMDAAQTKVIVASVLAGVGVAALGLGLYQLLSRPEQSRPAAEVSVSGVGVQPVGGGATLSVVGRF